MKAARVSLGDAARERAGVERDGWLQVLRRHHTDASGRNGNAVSPLSFLDQSKDIPMCKRTQNKAKAAVHADHLPCSPIGSILSPKGPSPVMRLKVAHIVGDGTR